MSFLVLCLKIHNILNWLQLMRVTFWTFTDLLCHLFNWWGSSRMWRCQLWKVSLLLALHCTKYSIFDTGIFNGNKKGEVSPHIFVTFSLQIIFLKIHVGLVMLNVLFQVILCGVHQELSQWRAAEKSKKSENNIFLKISKMITGKWWDVFFTRWFEIFSALPQSCKNVYNGSSLHCI